MSKPKRPPLPDVLRQLLARGFDPLLALLECAAFRLELTAEDLACPVIQTLASGGDYEVVPNTTSGSGKPYVLQTRMKLRAECASTLMRHAYPAMKTVSPPVSVEDNRLIVNIRNYAAPALPDARPERQVIELPAAPNAKPLSVLEVKILPLSVSASPDAGQAGDISGQPPRGLPSADATAPVPGDSFSTWATLLDRSPHYEPGPSP